MTWTTPPHRCFLLLCTLSILLAASPLATAVEEDAKKVNVVMKTSLGDLVIELDVARAPISCENFLRHTDEEFYNGTIFHRVIPGFMIQGGGYTPDMNQKKTKPPIKNEWQNGLKNKRGTLAMARLGGRADSATCQFFINVKDNPGLDAPRDGAAYAVFAKVVKGMDVVDRIKAVKTTRHGGHQNVPAKPVVIEKVTREAAGDQP